MAKIYSQSSGGDAFLAALGATNNEWNRFNEDVFSYGKNFNKAYLDNAQLPTKLAENDLAGITAERNVESTRNTYADVLKKQAADAQLGANQSVDNNQNYNQYGSGYNRTAQQQKVETQANEILEKNAEEEYTTLWNKEASKGGTDIDIHDRVEEVLKSGGKLYQNPNLTKKHEERGAVVAKIHLERAQASNHIDGINRARAKTKHPYKIAQGADGNYYEQDSGGKQLKPYGDTPQDKFDPKIFQTYQDAAKNAFDIGDKENAAKFMDMANKYHDRTNPYYQREKARAAQVVKNETARPQRDNIQGGNGVQQPQPQFPVSGSMPQAPISRPINSPYNEQLPLTVQQEYSLSPYAMRRKQANDEIRKRYRATRKDVERRDAMPPVQGF